MTATVTRRAVLVGAIASTAALAVPSAAATHVAENSYERVRRLQREISEALADLIADGGPDYVSVVAADGTGRFTRATMKFSDARVRLITEIAQGMRIIKFFAYEEDFIARVNEARASEMQQKRKVAVTTATNTTLLGAGPFIVALLTFLTYG